MQSLSKVLDKAFWYSVRLKRIRCTPAIPTNSNQRNSNAIMRTVGRGLKLTGLGIIFKCIEVVLSQHCLCFHWQPRVIFTMINKYHYGQLIWGWQSNSILHLYHLVLCIANASVHCEQNLSLTGFWWHHQGTIGAAARPAYLLHFFPGTFSRLSLPCSVR